jgi:hypothetical protein
MPRYFFHVRESVDSIDNEGTAFPGPDEARSEAVVAAGEMLKDYWWQVLEKPRLAIVGH